MYSFSKSQEEHETFYEKSKQAYIKIFERVGIGSITYLTFASGGTFSKYSHEFQTITGAGEDIIYVDEEKGMAINKEIYNDEVIKNLGLKKEELVEKEAVEVGNIFTLGTKFSEPFDLRYKNEGGEDRQVFMGSYGIGLGRVMGTVVEVLADARGIIWPESIAPYKYHLVSVLSGKDDEIVISETDKLYDELMGAGVDVLYDDRDIRAGEKFVDSDLIGIPKRIIVSAKTIKEGKYELKMRVGGESKLVDKSALLGS